MRVTNEWSLEAAHEALRAALFDYIEADGVPDDLVNDVYDEAMDAALCVVNSRGESRN